MKHRLAGGCCKEEKKYRQKRKQGTNVIKTGKIKPWNLVVRPTSS